jgi:glycosyltransferase involved in cell wall biosynthesis
MNEYLKDLSVIVPVYNEKTSIINVLERLTNVLDAENIDYEIIAVNDGSLDGTSEKLDAIKNPKIKIIHHPYNRGYGSALKTGIIKSVSENICIIDADNTYPEKMIPVLFKEIDKYDMVVGSRTGTSVSIPNFRKFAKWFIGKLANYLAGTSIPDLNSGLRIFKKSLALPHFNILPSGFSFTTTITLASFSGEYFIKYIPIDYYDRSGKSKIRPVKHTMEFTLLVFRMIMYFKPLKIFIPISLFFFFTGAYRMIFTIITRNRIHEFSVLTIVISVTILLLGLLADMIVKTRNIGKIK